MKMWAQVIDGKIVHGPMYLPDSTFTKEKKNSDVEVSALAVKSGWLPVFDNSLEVDKTKFAISAEFKVEIFPDRVVKTHKVKEFPPEFLEAYDDFVNAKKASGG